MRKAEKVEEEEDMKTTKLKDLGIGERFILNDEVYIKTNHSSLEFNFDENGDYYEYIAWECVCTLPKCKFGEGSTDLSDNGGVC